MNLLPFFHILIPLASQGCYGVWGGSTDFFILWSLFDKITWSGTDKVNLTEWRSVLVDYTSLERSIKGNIREEDKEI